MTRKKTTEEFIADARKKHGDVYEYGKTIYEGKDKKVIITCKKHGDFEQTAGSHLYGKGCPKCGRERTAQAHELETEQFIQKAIARHGTKYIYEHTTYIDCYTPVVIECKKLKQVPHRHLSGRGCPKCGNEQKRKKQKWNAEKFIEEAQKIHGDKFDYSLVLASYVNQKTKVPIVCDVHGTFEQAPSGASKSKTWLSPLCWKKQNDRDVHQRSKNDTWGFIRL